MLLQPIINSFKFELAKLDRSTAIAPDGSLQMTGPGHIKGCLDVKSAC
jgi:hypothetical protein